MACNLTKGRTLSCTQAIGGIKRVFFSLWAKNYWSSGLTYNATDVYQIDGFDASDGDTTMVRFDTRPNLSSMTVTTANGDATAGTPAFYDQSCELVLQKIDTLSIPSIKELGDSRTICWVLDMNDRVWVLGLKHGCRVTGGTIVTGVARGDMSGFTISVTAQEGEPLYAVKWSASDTELTANYPFAQLTNVGSKLTVNASVTPL